MSGAHGGERRGGGGGHGSGGGRAGGGGRGNINMTQAELDNLLQQQVNMAMATFQAGLNAMGGVVVNPPPPQCSYKKFRDYQPHNFAGTEGAVGLLR